MKRVKMKGWVTVQDAAQIVTEKLGEPFSTADIYQCALDGRLDLSIYLPGEHTVAPEDRILPVVKHQKVQGLLEPNPDNKWRMKIYQLYRQAENLPNPDDQTATISLKKDGEVLLFCEYLQRDEFAEGLEAGYYITFSVPDDLQVVVKPDTLDKLTQGTISNDADQTEPDPRSKSSYLKLIAVLIVKGYGYDPKEKRSNTATEILNDGAELGIDISARTIRRVIDEAKTYLRE